MIFFQNSSTERTATNITVGFPQNPKLNTFIEEIQVPEDYVALAEVPHTTIIQNNIAILKLAVPIVPDGSKNFKF